MVETLTLIIKKRITILRKKSHLYKAFTIVLELISFLRKPTLLRSISLGFRLVFLTLPPITVTTSGRLLYMFTAF